MCASESEEVSSPLLSRPQIVGRTGVFLCGKVLSLVRRFCACVFKLLLKNEELGNRREEPYYYGIGIYIYIFHIPGEPIYESTRQKISEDYLIFIGPKGAHCQLSPKPVSTSESSHIPNWISKGSFIHSNQDVQSARVQPFLAV